MHSSSLVDQDGARRGGGRRPRSQFLRYVCVGGAAFVVDLLAYYAFRAAFGIGYLTATTAAFCVGSVFNYVLSIKLVFSIRAVGNRHLEFLLFFLIGVAGAGINALLIYAFLDLIGLPYHLGKIMSAAALLMFNFQARRTVLFSRRRPRHS